MFDCDSSLVFGAIRQMTGIKYWNVSHWYHSSLCNCSLWSGVALVSMCGPVNRKTSMQTVAIEPHSANPAGSVLSALAQMWVKSMGGEPCCFPCQRFRPWTERYHEWTEAVCDDPFAQIQKRATIIHWSDMDFVYLIVRLKLGNSSSFVFVLSLFTISSTINATQRLPTLYKLFVLLYGPTVCTLGVSRDAS